MLENWLKYLVTAVLVTYCHVQSNAFADELKPIYIETKEDPRISNGSFADLAGFSDEIGPLMALRDLTLYNPVRISVISKDSQFKLHLKISKPGGTDVIFDGDTDDSGAVTAKFRSINSGDKVYH